MPVVPVINQSGKEWGTFLSISRAPQVIKPTVRYRGIDDLIRKLEDEIIAKAEAKLVEVRPPDDGQKTRTAATHA